jgi:replicative DNA helicase
MRKRSEFEAKPAVEFVIPHSPLNEQIVLAAAIVGGNDVLDPLLVRLQPEHFYVDEHRAIWTSLRELRRKKLTYDPATLQTIAGDAVRISYLTELANIRPDVPENLEHHIEGVQWDRQRTIAVNGPISGLLEALKKPNEAPERVRALARHVAQSFEGHSERQFIYDSKQLVHDAMAEIRKRIEGYAVYPFGIDGLDYYEADLTARRRRRMVPGAAPGTITIVTGVPGSGKSTFTGHLALGQANQKRRVAYGAWEMQAPMTMELIAALSLGWSRADLLDPETAEFNGMPLTHELLVQLEERMHELGKFITFVQNPFRRRTGDKRTNERNLDLINSILVDTGCEVFIADLWARCLTSRKPEDEEEALFRQQAMLEECGVHGILIHQQRHKDVEMRADKRPTREGIKGSGAYLEVADNMIGTHLPAQWKRIEDDKFEAIILKQRYGKWPIAVEFGWDAQSGRISGGRSIAYEQAGDTSFGEVGKMFREPGDHTPKASRGKSR